MKLFIPCNDQNNSLINQGFEIKPLVIEAYKYHLTSEKTQNFDIKKVITGTDNTNKGRT
jgi:hypothetical protein